MVEVRLYDDVNENHAVITSGGAVKIIPHHDYSMHKGHAFTAKHIWYDNVASAACDILFVTNSTNYVHLFYDFEAGAKGEFSVHEDVTTTSAGSTITTYNRNRRNTSEALSVVSYDPGVSSAGTTLTAKLLSGIEGKSVGGGGGSSIGEYLLKQSSTYMFRFTDKSASTADCMIALSWDEGSHSDV